MARNSTNEPNRLISASVGLAVPADRNNYGYLSEHHAFGETAKKSGDYAEDLAATMLATTLGLPFDPEKAWDEREQDYKMSGKVVRTMNMTQSAEGHKDGLWTTVIAVAILLDEAADGTEIATAASQPAHTMLHMQPNPPQTTQTTDESTSHKNGSNINPVPA
jgi:hypothetical protein